MPISKVKRTVNPSQKALTVGPGGKLQHSILQSDGSHLEVPISNDYGDPVFYGAPSRSKVYSNGTKAIVIASSTKFISIVDLVNKQVIKTICTSYYTTNSIHGYGVETIAINSTETKAAISVASNVLLLDLVSLSYVEIPLVGSSQGLQFSPDDTKIVACGSNGAVNIINLTNNNAITSVTFTGAFGVAINSNNKVMVTNNSTVGSALYFDLNSPGTTSTISCSNVPTAVVMNATKALILSRTGFAVDIINLSNLNKTTVVLTGYTTAPTDLKMSPDGNTAVVVGGGRYITIIELNNNNAVTNIDCGTYTLSGKTYNSLPYSVEITSDNKALVARSTDCKLSIVDLATKSIINTIDCGKSPTHISLNNNIAVLSNIWGYNISIFNTTNNSISHTAPFIAPNTYQFVRVSNDSAKAVINFPFCLIDLIRSGVSPKFNREYANPSWFEMSGDGRFIVLSTGTQLAILDGNTFETLKILDDGSSTINVFRISPDSSKLAWAHSGGNLNVCDLNSSTFAYAGQAITTINQMEFTRDSKKIIANDTTASRFLVITLGSGYSFTYAWQGVGGNSGVKVRNIAIGSTYAAISPSDLSKTVTIYKYSTDATSTFTVPYNPVSSVLDWVSIDPKNNRLVVSNSPTLYVYSCDGSTASLLGSFDMWDGGTFSSHKYTPNGNICNVVYNETTVNSSRYFPVDIVNYKNVNKNFNISSNMAPDISASSDFSRVAYSSDGNIYVINTQNETYAGGSAGLSNIRACIAPNGNTIWYVGGSGYHSALYWTLDSSGVPTGGNNPVSMTTNWNTNPCIGVTPDGTKAITARYQSGFWSDIVVINTSTKTISNTATTNNYFTSYDSVAANNNYAIIYKKGDTSNTTFYLYNISTNSVSVLSNSYAIKKIMFIPGSNNFVLSDSGLRIMKYNISNLNNPTLLVTTLFGINDMDISSDGSKLMVATGNILVYDLVTNTPSYVGVNIQTTYKIQCISNTKVLLLSPYGVHEIDVNNYYSRHIINTGGTKHQIIGNSDLSKVVMVSQYLSAIIYPKKILKTSGYETRYI